MQYALNCSGTGYLSTANQNYSMSWWIPCLFASAVIFRLLFANIWSYLFFCFLYLPWCLIEYRKPVISVKADFDASDLL